jgi:hypothetical protein
MEHFAEMGFGRDIRRRKDEKLMKTYENSIFIYLPHPNRKEEIL